MAYIEDVKFIPLLFVLLGAATIGIELLVVPIEFRFVDELSRWTGYDFIWSVSALRQFGDIAIRWDIISFEICVSITFAFVSYAIVPRTRGQSRL